MFEYIFIILLDDLRVDTFLQYIHFLASLYFNSNSESVRLHYCHLVDPSFLL